MSRFKIYSGLQKAWNTLLAKEPSICNQERERHILLLKSGRIEEYFALAIENPPLFSSLFSWQNGFLLFEENLSFTEEVQRIFCHRLLELRTSSNALKALWDKGAFDALIFRALGQVEEHNTVEKELLYLASLRSVSIPSGSFFIPNPYALFFSDEDGTEVCVQGFTMSRYNCTQALYERVMGENPSLFKGATHPVEHVTWYNSILFCNQLSEREGLEPAYILSKSLEYNYGLSKRMDVAWNEQANGYRLPTQEEWEYAARAGENHICAGSANMDEVAWHLGNSEERTHPVAQKKSNGFGLYDMSGNVFEWIWNREQQEREWKKHESFRKSRKTLRLPDTKQERVAPPKQVRRCRGGYAIIKNKELGLPSRGIGLRLVRSDL